LKLIYFPLQADEKFALRSPSEFALAAERHRNHGCQPIGNACFQRLLRAQGISETLRAPPDERLFFFSKTQPVKRMTQLPEFPSLTLVPHFSTIPFTQPILKSHPATL
jgi:hypothetical protein